MTIDNLIQPIWEASPYPIAVIGYDADPKDRKFFYVNPAFTTLTGYTRAEAVGKPASLLDRRRTERTKVAECETALKKGTRYEAAIVHYRKDGSEYVSRILMAPLVEPDGRADFLILNEIWVSSPDRDVRPGDLPGVARSVPLTLPMPLKEYPEGRLPQHLQSHPLLNDPEVQWIKMRRGRLLPERSDFDLNAVLEWAPHLSIATVTPEGRFQFRLFGTDRVRVYGRDLTGSFLDELTPLDLWAVVIVHYQEVVETKKPLFAPISVANGRWYNEVSRMLLPLSSGGNAVAFVMAADYSRNDPISEGHGTLSPYTL
ncbi:MAG: PAS domain-containing protein [Alphaproteobacteria bacterium]